MIEKESAKANRSISEQHGPGMTKHFSYLPGDVTMRFLRSWVADIESVSLLITHLYDDYDDSDDLTIRRPDDKRRIGERSTIRKAPTRHTIVL